MDGMSQDFVTAMGELYGNVSFGGRGGGGGGGGGLSKSDYACAAVGYAAGAASKNGAVGAAAGLACTKVANTLKNSKVNYGEASRLYGHYAYKDPTATPAYGPR
jgi:hypothetical protein